MAWRPTTIDPSADGAVPETMAAFEAAERAGLPPAECYLAAVEVWRRAHPDQAVEYASSQAVEVILKAKTGLRVGA